MYNQQSGSTFGSSQFRGQQQQQKYQPVGLVQSQYGQNQNQYQNQGQAFGQSQQSINSFHTANYRGNQQGHDSYLRSDSQNPSQFASGTSASSYGVGGQQSNWAGTAQSAASFHTANYRGNQPGHDSYLRSDSQNPSQAGYGFAGTAQSQYQPQFNFQAQGQTQGQAQYTSPQSFHTANYRGNQQGHDSYLRSDSSQPSSTGFSGTGYRF